MDQKYIIQRNGRDYVLYAGLLNEAHKQGLKSIETELLREPLTEPPYLAVSHARVEFEDGRVFTGIGDASPASVGKNIVPHIVRMSETRAKARALRDALNIDALLDGEEDEETEEMTSVHNLHNLRGATASSRGTRASEAPLPPEDITQEHQYAIDSCRYILRRLPRKFRPDDLEALGKEIMIDLDHAQQCLADLERRAEEAGIHVV